MAISQRKRVSVRVQRSCDGRWPKATASFWHQNAHQALSQAPASSEVVKCAKGSIFDLNHWHVIEMHSSRTPHCSCYSTHRTGAGALVQQPHRCDACSAAPLLSIICVITPVSGQLPVMANPGHAVAATPRGLWPRPVMSSC